VLEQGGQFAGINRKVQLKALQWSGPKDGGAPEGGNPKTDGAKPRVTEALLILKHGGVLTHAGRAQVNDESLVFQSFPKQAGGYRHAAWRPIAEQWCPFHATAWLWGSGTLLLLHRGLACVDEQPHDLCGPDGWPA
jgi:Histidine phosphatase superfamily (branch 2)